MEGGEKKIEKNGTFSTLRRFGLFRAFSTVFGRFSWFLDVDEGPVGLAGQ